MVVGGLDTWAPYYPEFEEFPSTIAGIAVATGCRGVDFRSKVKYLSRAPRHTNSSDRGWRSERIRRHCPAPARSLGAVPSSQSGQGSTNSHRSQEARADGLRREAVSRFTERILTLVATRRQQGRPLLDFLVAAGQAALRGVPRRDRAGISGAPQGAGRYPQPRTARVAHEPAAARLCAGRLSAYFFRFKMSVNVADQL